MPDTRQPLGQTIVNGLAGLIYDDPITLWGSVLAVLATWLLVVMDLLSTIWIGVALVALVWLAIAISLTRAVIRDNRAG